jgi:hypothetical protein
LAGNFAAALLPFAKGAVRDELKGAFNISPGNQSIFLNMRTGKRVRITETRKNKLTRGQNGKGN